MRQRSEGDREVDLFQYKMNKNNFIEWTYKVLNVSKQRLTIKFLGTETSKNAKQDK